ncbi:toxin-antitoxin system YwqK family antitoxin [Mangrovimonas cancribranchiae]|uniref:Toxin-antitoxin system YwqK family antitoxin n=1 Tax=Mangrovimonas cancribranchiae TaxID=3080055 RepID=A0AAU6NZR2_9FLAO
MKSTLITITFLFLSIHLTAQVSKSIIGKWVPVKTDFYSDSELENTVKQNSNKSCVSYIEFLKEGIIMTKDFNSDCEEIKADPGIFNKIGEDWYKISVDELKDQKVQIEVDGNQMKMHISTGETSKAVALLKRYSAITDTKAKKEKEDEIMYKDGVKHGLAKYYHANGQLSSIGSYYWGRKINEWKFYNKNGVLIKIGNYANDKATGVWKYYDENGLLTSAGNFENGIPEGEWRSYYANNEIEMIGSFLNGKKEGKWNEYFDNGALKSTGYYQNNEKIGVWKFYDKYGGLIRNEKH